MIDQFNRMLRNRPQISTVEDSTEFETDFDTDTHATLSIPAPISTDTLASTPSFMDSLTSRLGSFLPKRTSIVSLSSSRVSDEEDRQDRSPSPAEGIIVKADRALTR